MPHFSTDFNYPGHLPPPTPPHSTPTIVPKNFSWFITSIVSRSTEFLHDASVETEEVRYQQRVHIVKAMVFSVVMYGCESWTAKKAECWRIDAFELWCWRRLLRVPWAARRCNQSILKEISPECSLEGLMLKLKLQYFGHLVQRTNSLEKTLMLGKIEGDDRGWDGWMASLTRQTWVWASSGSWRWTWKPGVLQSVGPQRVTGLSDWTELNTFTEARVGF